MIVINYTNIKALLGLQNDNYQTRIALLIPQMIEDICSYCRNDFLMEGICGKVYDSGSLVITSTDVTHNTDILFIVGDWIRLYGTEYNNGLYQIKSIDGKKLTIETSKSMRAETVTGYIALVLFPDSFLNIVANYINNTVVNSNTSGLKSEQIDDLKLEYFASYDSKSFLSMNSSVLNEYRQVYNKGLTIEGCDCQC